MCSLINANQLLQEESHGSWKKVDKFANVDNLLQEFDPGTIHYFVKNYAVMGDSHGTFPQASGECKFHKEVQDSQPDQLPRH
jgi:hypothetical protein